MPDDVLAEEVKEVYARFGLAFYHAQVLEHSIVNALLILDLIPTRRHNVSSQDEWESIVEAFMGHHFEATMGRMIQNLRSVTEVPSDLEVRLRDALRRRNWLAHDFFRERAVELTTSAGRDQMISEVDECRACFEASDERLEEIVTPVRNKVGITDQLLEQKLQEMIGTGK